MKTLNGIAAVVIEGLTVVVFGGPHKKELLSSKLNLLIIAHCSIFSYSPIINLNH
jgi:hypothetical protein